MQALVRFSNRVEALSREVNEIKPHSLLLPEENKQLQSELAELRQRDEENKQVIAYLQGLLNGETERANEYCLEGLKAATILHEALKLPANRGTCIKKKIKQALLLIDDYRHELPSVSEFPESTF